MKAAAVVTAFAPAGSGIVAEGPPGTVESIGFDSKSMGVRSVLSVTTPSGHEAEDGAMYPALIVALR